jgi:hypothetical protein
MKVGTKVRTLYEHSELATIVKPRREQLPKPGDDWFLIKFELDGKKIYCHRDMLAAANQQ